jgi:hypothetical protein
MILSIRNEHIFYTVLWVLVSYDVLRLSCTIEEFVPLFCDWYRFSPSKHFSTVFQMKTFGNIFTGLHIFHARIELFKLQFQGLLSIFRTREAKTQEDAKNMKQLFF